MKHTLYLISVVIICTLTTISSRAQIINTYAGNGTAGHTGDSAAAALAEINGPNGIAIDSKGNIYIADYGNNVIRKVTNAGIIYTIAGNYISGYNGDSIMAVSAMLKSPTSVAVDKYGNIYIADNGNFRVRKVDTFGIITTVAGIGGSFGFGDSGDGSPATSAHIYAVGVAVDNNLNIYIADGNTCVRKVTHTTGIISTVAGSNTYGYGGDGGPATSASFSTPTSVAIDTLGNLYIADNGDNRVRKVNSATGIITTVAGGGTVLVDGGSADSAKVIAYYVALDGCGNLYISDNQNNRIRKVDAAGIITTIAGGGTVLGDGGPATSAALSNPLGIVSDGLSNLYIADNVHNRIRKVSGLADTLHLCQGGSIAPAGALAGTWTSTDISIATVNATGTVTGTAAGMTTVKCTAGLDTGTITVVVDSLPAAGMISGTDSLCPGDTITLTASVAGGIWASSTTALAIVFAPGMVAGIASGTDTILYTVTDGRCSAVADYVIAVRTAAACGDTTVTPTAVTTTTNAGGDDINVYPNPNSGSFIVSGTLSVKDNEPVTIIISDMLGHIVSRGTATTSQGEMKEQVSPGSLLRNGMYVVQLIRHGESKIFHFVVAQ